MHALSVRVRNRCAPSPYTSAPYAHAQHAHQFSHLSNVHFVYPQHVHKELMHALSIGVRNWCVHALSICVINYACTERKSLKNILSICVRNWCLSWAYASVSYVYAQHKRKIPNLKGPFKTFWAYVEGADACTERASQELMRALSVLIRNWCTRSACISEIKLCLAPPKIKIATLYFNLKVTYPERLMV
jgi:hypothetical protein